MKPQSSAAFSLIDALIGIAIVGVLSIVAMRSMDLGRSVQGAVLADQDRDIIVRNLLQSISCLETFLRQSVDIKTSQCDRPIPIYGDDGILLVSADPMSSTKMGRWTVRARCFNAVTNPDDYRHWGIQIEVARGAGRSSEILAATNPSAFALDDASGQRLDWGHKKAALTPATLRLCARGFLDSWPSGS